jgi:hypothetical protein
MPMKQLPAPPVPSHPVPLGKPGPKIVKGK